MPDQSVPATTAADDAFGADLYRLLSEPGSDVVFSPVSVASVLQMALCGARGQPASELAGALHLDGSPDGAGRARRPPPLGGTPACRWSPTSPPGWGRA